MPLQLVLTPRQAVTALQISPRKLWELTHQGEIPHARVGRRIYYRVCDLEAWLESRLVNQRQSNILPTARRIAIDDRRFTVESELGSTSSSEDNRGKHC